MDQTRFRLTFHRVVEFILQKLQGVCPGMTPMNGDKTQVNSSVRSTAQRRIYHIGNLAPEARTKNVSWFFGLSKTSKAHSIATEYFIG